MATKHEQIVNELITEWSVQGRGRLFKNHTGGAYMYQNILKEYFVKQKNRQIKVVILAGATFIRYGLRAKNEKLVDIVGFEFINKTAVWCVIEVKTKAHKKLATHQADCLNMAVRFGGKGYVAMELDEGYELKEWVHDES